MTFINSFSHIGGMNSQASPFLLAPNSQALLMGANVTYEPGAILKCPGYYRKVTTAQAGKNVGGAFDFIQIPGTQKLLYTCNDSTDDDTQLFYDNSGTPAEITAAETAWANFANISVEMESFIAHCFFAGYGSVDGHLPVGSLTGTTFSTSTNVTNMAQGKYIKRYRDRLYVANCRSGGTNYPYRVYFSSVPSSGAITWTPATDYIDVDYSEEITGLYVNWDLLIIFTEERAYYYNQQTLKKLWDRGCTAHRTVKNNGMDMFFVNRDGAWTSRNAGEPQNISGEVLNWFRNGNTANMFAEVTDEEYNVNVGDVTVRDVAYTNVVLTYNAPFQSWRGVELADDIQIFAKFSNKTNDSTRLYMGDDNGVIFDQAKYTDTTVYATHGAVSSISDGTAINSEVDFPPIVINPELYKTLREMIALAERAQGVKLLYRIIDTATQDTSPYKPLMQLTKYINRENLAILAGSILQIKMTEHGKSPYWKVYGLLYDLIAVGKN